MAIENYRVIEPPTSDMVLIAALEAIRTRMPLMLELQAERDIPRPNVETVALKIAHLKLIGKRQVISGSAHNHTKETNIISLTVTTQDPDQPAQAELVS